MLSRMVYLASLLPLKGSHFRRAEKEPISSPYCLDLIELSAMGTKEDKARFEELDQQRKGTLREQLGH